MDEVNILDADWRKLDEELDVIRWRTRRLHQDYGGPIGNRIVGRHPEWLEWQVIQNSNAHEEGFTAAWDGIRHALWVDRSAETEAPLAPFLQLEGVKLVYTHGHRDPEQISPDNWNMDLHFLERPGARKVQLDLLYDSGHFTVEDSLDEITAHITRYYDSRVNGSRA